MPSPEPGAGQFYFALPRLVARLRGRNPERTERNWIEANTAGTMVMLVSYLAIARCLVGEAAGWKQIASLLPLVVVTWCFWLLVLYLDAQIIKLLRALGVLQELSNARAQSVLVGCVTTALALSVLKAGPMLSAIGAIWLGAVCVNLLAAVLLGLWPLADESQVV